MARLDYRTVRDADLAPLSEAVTTWRNLPGRFDSVAESFRTGVTKGLRGSDWEGKAAEAAFDTFDAVAKQLKAAADEARGVHRLLDSAHQAFASAQKRLKDVEADVEAGGKLRMSAAGEVSFDAAAAPEGQAAALQKSYQETVQSYNDRIARILDDATEADTALNWALTQDHNGRGRGFDGDGFHSIKDAQQARRRAAADADAVLRIAALGDEATIEQLVRMDRLMSKHEGDPYFATRFASGLGAKGTIDFWRGVTDRDRPGEDGRKALVRLKQSLGFTLATATHSDSAAMTRWKDEMIALGGDREKGTYGFQVMGALMRNGEYETDFLQKYGKSLIEFERDHASGNPGDLWNTGNGLAYLNVGGSDWGNDPMTGYMEALGHNPEAAKALFASDKWHGYANEGDLGKYLDEDFKYLVEDRKWPDDAVTGEKSGSGYRELGHALEAAALGIPYDRPDLGLHRDYTAANVMDQVVAVTAANPGFVAERPGIAESLGRMGAGYIDDLDWAVADFGDSDHDQDSRDRAYGRPSLPENATERELEEYRKGLNGRMSTSTEGALGFLMEVGQHEGAYEILSSGQHEYTIRSMKAFTEPGPEATWVLETGAKVHGVLDQSRINDIDAMYGDKADEANRKLAEAAEWKKYGISQGLGVVAGAATLPFGGPTTAAGVAFAVPMVVEGASSALNTEFGIAIDHEIEKQAAKYDREEMMEKREFLTRGYQRAMDPADAYIQAQKNRSSEWAHDLDIEGAYNNGNSEADQWDED